ncbi:cytochrome p450 [Lichtheimia corymbifera JMRC:FSU:9682]|uniref:Cytochrome p450 n=1 Tax=Lichtheimia corymbifera JMRC:FSU:9682 TaxID=1263082 RepID=A0A068SB73_9FUNG|nr:cytochrome p450 [Lichtheimia corymbifera JMRC:FSU:9682]
MAVASPQIKNMVTMDRLQDIYSTVSQHVVAHASAVTSRQRKISISAAVALVAFYTVYKVVTPPANLRHIPSMGFFSYLNAFLRGKQLHDISKNVVLPHAVNVDNGVYLRFDILGWTVHIARPEAAKRFLLKSDIFPKADMISERGNTLFGKFVFNRNIVMLNGDDWKAQRKVANPAFHRAMPVELFGRLTQKTLKKMEEEMDGGTLNFHDITERYTLEVIGLAGFEFEFGAIENPKSEWVDRYQRLIEATFNPWFIAFPNLDMRYRFLFPSRKRLHREMDAFLDKMSQVITHKRELLNHQKTTVPESERDILTLMIEAEKNGEGSMTNEELQNNLLVFFIAGHDTTSLALSYAAYYLAVNPDVQRKAREEAIRVLGDAPEDVMPTVEQTRQLTYINMVIKETLRMSPPLATIPVREASEDTELCGTFIPKGTRTFLDIYEIQHNPTVWKDPETFKPERFKPGGEAEELAGSGMSWLPFSNGSRQCIGLNFSLVEQRVFLPMLLRKYEWHLPEDSIHKERIQTMGLAVIKPKDLKLTFKKRY